jgi:DNA-binding transcriptional LysR family regulator
VDLRALRYFVFVAEEGSVHAGARRALVAQPALSVALKKLEREVGAALFDRSPRGVTLTAAGAALLPRARQILRLAGQAPADMQLLAETDAAPVFTIGLIEGQVAAAEITGPILQTFQRIHPELRVEARTLDFANQFDCLLDGSVDVAIVRAPCDDPDLVLEPLFSEPCVLVASPEHRLANVGETTVESVLGEQMLEVFRAPRAWRAFWNLDPLRNERSRSILSPAVSLMSYSMDVLRNGVISPMAASGWRLGGLGQTLRGVRMVDGPRNEVCIGYRHDGDDERVQSLISVARQVAGELLPMIADAEPLHATER